MFSAWVYELWNAVYESQYPDIDKTNWKPDTEKGVSAKNWKYVFSR